MPMSEKVLDKIDAAVKNLCLNPKTEFSEAKNSPFTVDRAPVEISPVKYVEVEDISNIEDLPFIPERMRIFAYRYALEHRTMNAWASEMGMSKKTLETWLRRKDVQMYIALTRYEQRMLNIAQHSIMQKNILKKINEILTMEVTGENIASVVSLIKFMYTAMTNPQGLTDGEGPNLRIDVNVPGEISRNMYRKERDVTPAEMDKLEAELKELELMEKAVALKTETY